MTPMVRFTTLSTLCAVLAGCATYPSGPTITALPGGNANFDQFRVDDYDCQGYARQVIGPPPGQAASESGLNSAAVGTALGATAGALLGSVSGNAGAGAALGAGTGLLFGGLAGTDAAASAGRSQQARYDDAYVQCMYAKGHQVPVSASVAARIQAQQPRPAPTPPSQSTMPAYPPPGTPPPPGY